MSKWNLIVDVANCTDCNLCTLALQDDNQLTEALRAIGFDPIELSRAP